MRECLPDCSPLCSHLEILLNKILLLFIRRCASVCRTACRCAATWRESSPNHRRIIAGSSPDDHMSRRCTREITRDLARISRASRAISRVSRDIPAHASCRSRLYLGIRVFRAYLLLEHRPRVPYKPHRVRSVYRHAAPAEADRSFEVRAPRVGVVDAYSPNYYR